MSKQKKKGGELTTQQIVTLVILIASFAIILFLLFRLNLGETTEKEICHNSVVLKGNTNLPDNALNLDCKTNYVCISKTDKCNKMSGAEVKKVSSKEEIYQVLADELADCWWMFGEGKINYVKQDLLSELYCSICSQISFDENVKEIPGLEEGLLSQEEFYGFMSNEIMSSGKQTYLEYLMGLEKAGSLKENLMKTKEGSKGIIFPEINLNKYHSIVMGISSEMSKFKWGALAGTIGLGLSMILPGSPIVGAIIAGVFYYKGTGIPIFLGTIVKGDSGNDYLVPSIIESSSSSFEGLKCKEIVTKA